MALITSWIWSVELSTLRSGLRHLTKQYSDVTLDLLQSSTLLQRLRYASQHCLGSHQHGDWYLPRAIIVAGKCRDHQRDPLANSSQLDHFSTDESLTPTKHSGATSIDGAKPPSSDDRKPSAIRTSTWNVSARDPGGCRCRIGRSNASHNSGYWRQRYADIVTLV